LRVASRENFAYYTGMEPTVAYSPEIEETPIDPPPWTARDVWLGVGFLALLYVLLLVAVVVFPAFWQGVDLGAVVSFGETIFLLPVWGLAIRKYRVGWGALGVRGFEGEMLALGCGLMFISFGVNFAYNMLLEPFGTQAQPDVVPMIASLPSPWLFMLGGVVIAPLVEEIFFRGFVFGGLRKRYGWRKAALASSALFAAIHLQLTAIVPIFVLGYIFAYLYHRSGSIWPAVLMHLVSNALALGAAYLLPQSGAL